MYSLKEILSGGFSYIWIYGAGKTGRKLWNGLNFLQINVNGIVESVYTGKVVAGTEICSLKNVETPPDLTAFIITTPENSHKEVISRLKRAGYGNICVWGSDTLCELWTLPDYTFEDRRKGMGTCCFVLAGYKEYLWERVFMRLSRFVPHNIDICIISSGIYSGELAKRSREQGWSYLSTEKNSVTLAQNIAYALFNGYEWVYKMDEDIFVTEHVFESLCKAYCEAQATSNYQVGIAVPLMPLNGCSYRTILEKTGKKEDYEKKFGRIVIGGNPESAIEKNPESAVFMWDECPHIDEMNRMFTDGKLYAVCNVRYSIGFMLMQHSFWEEMQGFYVSGGTDMGADEEELCGSCMNRSRAIIISQNAVAGHFSFGRQTERMKQFYIEKPEKFEIC